MSLSLHKFQNQIHDIIRKRNLMSKTKYILLLCLFYSFNFYSTSSKTNDTIIAEETICQEGFIAGTLVKTIEGYTAIENLQIGDTILGFDPIEGYQEKCVLNVGNKQAEKYIKFLIGDETIYTTFDQKFYLPEEKIWLEAKNLTTSHI